MAPRTAHEPVSPARWLADRDYLQAHRHELAKVAERLYPDNARVAGTSLLTRPDWLPDQPIELADVALTWRGAGAAPAVDGTGSPTAGVRAVDVSGGVYSTYSQTMSVLARPAVFEDRWVYRVLDVDLGGHAPQLTFGRGHYFGGVDVGEAAGHELAARQRGAFDLDLADLPLRAAVGDPCALARRPAPLAVSTLTIRHDRRSGRASCILHWRDPAKVAHAGGLHQVVPVGVFQPAQDSEESERRDFDLWKCMVREYAEELLGEPEQHDRPIDYDTWSTFQDLTDARSAGHVRVRCLGVGVDPVTLAVDLLAVAVFESDVYDQVFGDLVDTNDEGDVSPAMPFDDGSMRPLLSGERAMQPAGLAVLALAWRHREHLLAA